MPVTDESLMGLSQLRVRNRATGQLLLRDVDLTVGPSSIVGLVGESGSGKSMTALAMMGLLPDSMEVVAGQARIGGRQHALDGSHGITRDASIIFQNPQRALNPTMRIGRQVERVCRLRDGSDSRAARLRSRELLEGVGISRPELIENLYPHQFSGGMCQRVMIAMALANRPSLLIADEPTTGLDVTIQAQILNLLAETSRATSCGILLITHDLAVVSETCDHVAVMYGGQVMESGPSSEILEKPAHPYTRHLFSAITAREQVLQEELEVDFSLTGCRFMHRCPYAQEKCRTQPPDVVLGDRVVACHFAEELHAAP